MSLLVESIWIYKGKIMHLPFHQERYERTLAALYPHALPVDLSRYINALQLQDEDIKCRILYQDSIQDIQYLPYHRPTIESLKIVYEDNIDYPYKFVERHTLQQLMDCNTHHDEILIVKHGLLTDAYYYNIVLEKEKNYFTPKHPLLHGVMRQHLIHQGWINEINIPVETFFEYETVHLINALNPLGRQVISISSVSG